MKIAIDTETRAVLTWRGGEVPPLSMTRGDRFPVEVKFISSGKFVEWPAMASGKLMLKQPGAYTALPVASALGWVKSGSGANAVYKFDLNLNTVELNALLTGASVNLVLEIEWIYENVTQSSVPVQVVVSKDYIQGNEAAPVNAVSFREVQLQKNATHVQWRYVGDLVWTNLVALDDLKGSEVEFQKGTTHIQWRYVGGTTWTNLVLLDDLKGAAALWNFTGPYNAGQVYAVGDIATYEGQTWYRKDANGGNVGDTPSEGAFWTIVSAAGKPFIQPNSQSASYTLQLADAGKYINISTGSVTVPSAVFASGDVISVYNNSAANQTITQGSGVTMYLAGTSTTGNRTLAQRGVATILCVGSNTFTIIGGGLT